MNSIATISNDNRDKGEYVEIEDVAVDDDDESLDDELEDQCRSLLGFQRQQQKQQTQTNYLSISGTSMTESVREKTGHLESFDFDVYESRVNQQHDHDITLDKHNWFEFKRWILTLLVGLGTALIAIFIERYTDYFMEIKMEYFTKALENDKTIHASSFSTSSYSFGTYSSFVVYAGISSIYILIASILVAFVAPPAKGSGITEIKATLNGIKLYNLLSFKTLICKAIGVLFSVAAGLPVGKEGPMIHSGAIVGAGISQGKSSNLGCDVGPKQFRDFRNDKEKRDFISCGAAAGVAAAFGSPIGGVLFVLEEGASFWHQSLTWRTFFCAMISAFIMNLYLTSANKEATFGMLGTQGGTFSFGKFEGSTAYQAADLLLFILMGIVGGLFGAVSNFFNEKISIFRGKFINNRYFKVVEAMFIGLCMSSISFWTSYYFGTCKERAGPFPDDLVTFYCDATKNEYNDLASLYTVSYSTSTKQLLHYTTPDSFTLLSLFMFFLPFYSMSCWTYGISVPSGLFVPSLLSGAAYGRICLEIMRSLNMYSSAPDGIFALIGASAMLGGIARMTISLTVIILECTGIIEWGLPVMLTLMSARWVGNYFNEGIYDIHIHLRHLPFLEFDPPFCSKYLRVQNIMTKDPICLDHIVQVKTVYEALQSNLHYAFPVVQENIFAGVIFRKHLCTLLKKKDFFNVRPAAYVRKPREGSDYSIADDTHSLAHLDFNAQYPRWPIVSSIHLETEDMDKWMDLTPYMNPTPHTMQEMTPVPRAFRLFRSLGLRQLVILNRTNKVVGIITRKELTPKHITFCLDSLSSEKKSRLRGYWHSFLPKKSTTGGVSLASLFGKNSTKLEL